MTDSARDERQAGEAIESAAPPADRLDWSWYGLLAEEVVTVDPRLVHGGRQHRDSWIVGTIDPETGEACSDS